MNQDLPVSEDSTQNISQLRLKVSTTPRLLLIFLISCEVLLVLLDAFINYGKLTEIPQFHRLFNIAREDGLATWFASTQFLACALFAWIISSIQADKENKPMRSNFWTYIAIGFVYLSADDAAEIHERLGSAFKFYAKNSEWAANLLEIYPSYPWQIVVGPIFLAAGIYAFYFLWKAFSDAKLRKYLIIAAICTFFAVCFDFIEGIDDLDKQLQAFFNADSYTVSHFSKSIEEFLEMVGISIVLASFLAYSKFITKN